MRRDSSRRRKGRRKLARESNQGRANTSPRYRQRRLRGCLLAGVAPQASANKQQRLQICESKKLLLTVRLENREIPRAISTVATNARRALARRKSRSRNGPQEKDSCQALPL